MTRLVDKSLVVAVPSRTVARFSMLQTLNDYARERLHASGELASLREHHAEYYARWLDASQPAYEGERQIEFLEEVDRDLENIRAAFEWSLESDNAERAAHIAVSMGWVWWVVGAT